VGTAKKVSSEKLREKPILEQTGGAGRGRTFELSRDTLRIGRTDDNEIVMKSDSVSRCHAYLKRSMNGDWIFQDNSSKNGILVNGERVFEARLNDGDLLVVGDFTFRFFAAHEQPMEKTTPAAFIAGEVRKSPAPKMPVKAKAPRPKPLTVAFPPDFDGVARRLENYSWIVGIALGIVAGGAALWWRSNRNVDRPGALPVVQAPPKPANVPVSTEQVTKDDLRMATPNIRKPKSDIRDLKVYLREGKNYLSEGDKESAAVAFRFALVLDPRNKEARAGLKSAGVKVDAAKAPPPKEERKPPTDGRKKAKVAELLKAAMESFQRRAYQDAIVKAEQVRKIEIPGVTDYLNEAKQIIDRARVKQKEDFEPFLDAALRKIGEGDFKGGAALCEEMLRTDRSYGAAKECLAKALDGMAGKGAK
jgi:tetratricopeptide (TPR) repeat protein